MRLDISIALTCAADSADSADAAITIVGSTLDFPRILVGTCGDIGVDSEDRGVDVLELNVAIELACAE